MTILEQLQNATTSRNDDNSIICVVWRLNEKVRKRYFTNDDFALRSKLYRDDYFTEEEYQIIYQKTKELVIADNWSNQELLNETLGQASGDDYDGCFTFMGQIEYNCYQEELEQRLRDCGFLPGE